MGLISFIKGLFNKPEPVLKPIQRSKLFPDKFYQNKIVEIDDSLWYFAKNSNVVPPTTHLFIEKFVDWKVDEDVFEEIIFDDHRYKLLYDATNDLFYLLQQVSKQPDTGSITMGEVGFGKDIFSGWSGVMTIDAKNELLAIFNREISKEADEYLFIELSGKQLDGQFIETRWYGIIAQPAMIK